MARDVPLPKEIHLAPQKRFVVRRQLARPRGALPANQRLDGIAEERVGILVVDNMQIGPRAQIGEKQETGLEVLGKDARCVHAGAFEQPGDVHEGPAVFLFRRRVHRHVARAVLERGAEVAPEACVLGSGSE